MYGLAARGVLRCASWHCYPWLAHGFSTRVTGDFLDWPADGDIAARFGEGPCGTAMLRQVHSRDYVRADRPWGPDRPAADAVLTDRPGVLVGVRTADCLPVLLADPRTRSVAAVHAGWRGAAAGVLPTAVNALAVEYGARPAEIEAAIGPGIGVCCFEVGEEVAGRFSERFVDRQRVRPHVDLASALEAQLARCGVARCETIRECTSCRLDRYFSHRAERGRTGRMLAVIGVRAKEEGRPNQSCGSRSSSQARARR